ncbi:TPA: DUF551 domain-containing protein [Escherichia coli]
MAQKEMTRITEERISEIISRIEMYGHGAGYTADEVLEIAQQMLALRQKEQHESNTCRLNFEHWLEQQRGKIDVDCGCVSTETFMHWLRVAYEAGNYPVTPDGWISCSERMPEIRQTVIGWNGYAVRQCVYTRNEYAKTQKGREPRFETLTGIWHGVTHWMPLPEPPQEVK